MRECRYAEDLELESIRRENVDLRRQMEDLRSAIRFTLCDLAHLADGDDCSLKVLKDAIGFDPLENVIGQARRGGVQIDQTDSSASPAPACSDSSFETERQLQFYTDKWDYRTLLGGRVINRGCVRGADIGEANSRVVERHPEIEVLVGASTSVSRRRKNSASCLVVWLLQIVAATRYRRDKCCDGREDSAADDCDKVVGQHIVPGDAGSGVDLDDLHESSFSIPNT